MAFYLIPLVIFIAIVLLLWTILATNSSNSRHDLSVFINPQVYKNISQLTVCVTRAGAGGGTPSDWKNAEA